MTIHDMISNHLAKPMTHRVDTTYSNGNVRSHETRSAEAAENYARGERRKIGRDLINRETGKTVRVTEVNVVAL